MTDLRAKVSFGQDTTFTEAEAIASAIEEAGFDVDHLIQPEDDEPHLYVMAVDGGGERPNPGDLADNLEGALTGAEVGMTDAEVRAVGRAIDYLREQSGGSDD